MGARLWKLWSSPGRTWSTSSAPGSLQTWQIPPCSRSPLARRAGQSRGSRARRVLPSRAMAQPWWLRAQARISAQTARASTHSATLFGLTRWGPGHCLTSPVLAMWRHQLIAEAMALPTGMPRSKWRCRAARWMIVRCHAALRLAGNLSIQFCLPGTFSRAPMLALPSDVLAQVVTCRILQGRTRPPGSTDAGPHHRQGHPPARPRRARSWRVRRSLRPRGHRPRHHRRVRPRRHRHHPPRRVLGNRRPPRAPPRGGPVTATEKSQEELLEQLADAGQRRANANRHELDGLLALRDAYEDIRKLAAEAEGKLTRKQIADAVGVTPQALYNI